MSELIEVTVPNDCYPGDSFLVEWAGESLTVVVPEDGYGGMTLAVEVGGGDGIEATSEVEVVVPDGCYPGDEFTVEYGESAFIVSVPDGSAPGDSIIVQPPPECLPPETADQQQRQQQQQPANSSCCSSSSSSAVTTSRSRSETVAAPSAGGLTTNAEGKGLNLALSVCGGLTLSLALQTAPTHPIGSTMEVLRSDGLWSLCTIKDYEWRGVTYTVQLTDLRLKYFVEEDDLRHPAESFSPQHSPGSIRPKKDRR